MLKFLSIISVLAIFISVILIGNCVFAGDDIDGWKAIDPKLADRCLSFESRIRQSQALIGSMIDHDLHQLGDEVEGQAINRGLEAWDLAVELRKRHRLAPIEPVWHYADELRTRRAKRREEATR